MKLLTRTVWLLGFISLFNDVASEMLYPVIPLYLQSIHFSVMFIGVLEGIAEATAGLTKGYFGKLSDNTGRRLPFVRLGYSLSAISKPMMAMFTFPLWIFTARSLDRLGKGVRTGARDALLSGQATPESKGRVFGFHRGMDTLGAVLGPSLALLYLLCFPGNYKALFYVAFIPGVVSIGCTFFIKEQRTTQSVHPPKTRFFDFIRYWLHSPAQYRRLVTGLLLFALINSSDMFLILKIKSSGFSDQAAIGVYIFYNLVYALLSYPLGGLGDRLGFKKVLIGGLLLFALVYAGMGMTNDIYIVFALFLIYGAYAAATDGISKAWISNITDAKDTATAIGTFNGFQSICSLLASSLAGVIWYSAGPANLFNLTAAATVAVSIYLMVMVKNTRPNTN